MLRKEIKYKRKYINMLNKEIKYKKKNNLKLKILKSN